MLSEIKYRILPVPQSKSSVDQWTRVFSKQIY
jgi:hypothetical protein